MNDSRCEMFSDENEILQDEIRLLKEEALPFFHEHVEEFKTYIVDQLSKDKNASLWKLSVEFISVLNLPFNMKRYMVVQSAKIRKCLEEKELSGEVNCSEDNKLKQQLVADWIKAQAPQHREDQIELQKQCLHQFKNEFEKALMKELCSCQIPQDLRQVILGNGELSNQLVNQLS